jgi:hypothetical protein
LAKSQKLEILSVTTRVRARASIYRVTLMYTIKYRLVESRLRPRRGDRIKMLFAAVHESAFGT